jgi:hypothetical protein
VIEQVDNAREIQLFQELGDLRAHAFQRFNLREQWVQDFGPHD